MEAVFYLPYFCSMIELGNYNTLNVARSTSVGVFLDDGEGTEVLLPNKYVPKEIQQNDSLKVFCYLDHQERPIATTLEPQVLRNGFGYLKAVEVNHIGAFMDWGLEKHLFVPFREQHVKMVPGRYYMVHCYLDEKSFRLVGSNKLDRFFKKDIEAFTYNEKVPIQFTRKTQLGWEVVVANAYKGLVFFDAIFREVEPGLKLQGYIKKVRDDNKLDISLQPQGTKMLNNAASLIYEILLAHNGFLPYHDKSAPEEIMSKFKLSKKAFKKGIGILYKERKIRLEKDGIYAVR